MEAEARDVRQSPLYRTIYQAIADGLADGLWEAVDKATELVDRLETAITDLAVAVESLDKEKRND